MPVPYSSPGARRPVHAACRARRLPCTPPPCTRRGGYRPFWLARHRGRRRRFTRSSSSGAGNSVHPGTSARVRSRKLRTAPAGTLSRTTVSPAARSSRCNRSRAGSGHSRTAASPAGSSRPRLSRSRRITQSPQGSVGCGGSAPTSRSTDSGSAARHRSATSTRHGADAGLSARTCAPTSADAPVVGGPSSPPGTPPHASHCAEASLRRVGRPPTGPGRGAGRRMPEGAPVQGGAQRPRTWPNDRGVRAREACEAPATIGATAAAARLAGDGTKNPAT